MDLFKFKDLTPEKLREELDKPDNNRKSPHAKSSYTPIVVMALNKKWELVEVFTEEKYKLEGEDNEQYGRALLVAYDQDQRALALRLIAAGAGLISTFKVGKINGGKNILHLAVEKQDEDLLKLLLQNKVRKEQQDSENNTPILLAAKQGSWNLVQLLAQAGNFTDETDSLQYNEVIKLAKEANQLEIVDILRRKIYQPVKTMPFPGSELLTEPFTSNSEGDIASSSANEQGLKASNSCVISIQIDKTSQENSARAQRDQRRNLTLGDLMRAPYQNGFIKNIEPMKNTETPSKYRERLELAYFEKVYQALYAGQSSAFKSANFVEHLKSKGQFNLGNIKNHTNAHSDSRSQKAEQLVRNYLNNIKDADVAGELKARRQLFLAIHTYAYENSGFFKRSINKKYLEAEAAYQKTVDSAEENSRTGQIRNALFK